MEPVLSHYSFLYLQSKYTWLPFETYADLWMVISVILSLIMSVFFTAINHKRARHETAHFMSTACLR